MSATTPPDVPTRKALHRLLWRLHFWAGLIGAPIVVFAAVTGLLYVLTPEVEAWRHAHLDRVPARAATLPLDAQVAAAEAAFPDRLLRHVVPAYRPGDTTQVYLHAPHRDHAGHAAASHDHGLPRGSIAYVDPHTGRVLGRLEEMDRFKTWARKLHSSALQGDGWRWALELGASWMLVLFASGAALWWPRSQARGGPGWRALVPTWGRGRRTWRDLHAAAALSLGLVLSVVLVTGLTWSRHSGENFRRLQDAVGQTPSRPANDLRSAEPAGAPPLGWQAVHDRVRAHAPDIAVQLTPPATAGGVWRAENFDRSQPQGRFVQAIDAHTGATLFFSGWNDLPALSRATAIGIPFHRGEFGVWNRVLLGLAAAAAIFSVVSGLAMWWLRRGRGRLAAPPLSATDARHVPWWLWPMGGALAVAMPVFGWSLAVLLVLEGLRLAAARRSGAEAAS